MSRKYKYLLVYGIFFVIILLFLFKVLFFRIDLTEEGRFSISQITKDVLHNVDDKIEIIIYIGDADGNIEYLKNSINDILDEFSNYTKHNISYSYVNPSKASSEDERNKTYYDMEQKGYSAITVSMRDADGKISQSIIFPWADVIISGDTLPVNLMKPLGMTGIEDSVNAGVEELEYNFIDAIRILNKSSFDKIAFIEGHGELSEIETYSISEALSRYFQIDRGVIGDDASILNDYKAIIIARPTEVFSESDKFVIDQYIMNGGKVLWMLDATKFSVEELSKSGISPVMLLDLNLNDMLFRYGIRIEAAVVQDLNAVYMPVNVAMVGEPPVYEQIPFTYSPLLFASPNSPITKNIVNVKSDFPSFVQQVSLENNIKMEVLLETSNASRVDMAPTNIDLKSIANIDPKTFVNAQYVPIAVVMQGEFESVFKHRKVPGNLVNVNNRSDKSVNNKMVVVANGNIIKNEIEKSKRNPKQVSVIPLGLDRITGQTYGNSTFITNTILALTDESNVMSLRNRTVKMRLLDKQKIINDRMFWQLFNALIPIILLTLFGIVNFFIKQFKYKTK